MLSRLSEFDVNDIIEFALTAIISLLLIGIIFIIPFFLLDEALGHDSPPAPSIIKAKSYTPSSTSTGVGTGISASGNSTVVVTTSHEDEKWALVVEVEGEACAVLANASFWASSKEGDALLLTRRIGKFTGLKYDWKIHQ